MKLLMIILVFLTVGALFIISENNLALRSGEAREELGQLYLSWFNQIFENSKGVVGYVAKLDWLPEK